MFEFFFGRSESRRVKKLEARVGELETALTEATEMLKRLASLSLQTGRELESLAEYVKRIEKRHRPLDPVPKKSDDFFN